MASELCDLLSALKPFHERASEAEDRLTRLESNLGAKEDAKIAELLKMVCELQSDLKNTQAIHASERQEASVEIEKLQAVNEKLKYRIVHLVRALKERGQNLA